MSLEKLSALLAAPAAPVEATAPYGWDLVEVILGRRLPTDFRQFVARYGSGDVAGVLRVLNPFSADPDHQLGRQMLERLSAVPTRVVEGLQWQGFRDPTGKSEGWLLWGLSANGEGLYWRMKGPPDGWRVWVGRPGDAPPAFRDQRVSMTAFVVEALRGQPSPRFRPVQPTGTGARRGTRTPRTR
jgi:hypothetical protein